MTKKIEKIVGKVTGFERITILVSAFYCLGLITRMQSEVLFGLPSFVEINRALPFAVAIQYSLFLLVPFAVVFIPLRICRVFVSRWMMCFVWLLLSLFFIVAFPMMFHYFLPYTHLLVPSPCGYWMQWLYTTLNFWKLYFSWASHLVGFGFLLLAIVIPFLARKSKIIRRDVSLKELRVLLVILGVITNIFYFNSFVYRNISQGVFGGARSFGILTIKNPPKSLLNEYRDFPSRYSDQFSFPCSIEGKSQDWVIVSNQKRIFRDKQIAEYDPAKNGLFAVKPDDVLMFNPTRQVSYKIGDEERMISVCLDDAIYRMDVLFRMACVLTNAVNTVSLANSIRGDKAIKMSTYINGACIGDCDVCRISPVVVGSTNAVVYAHFPQVSLVGMQTMSDFQSIVNSTNNELTVCLEGIADVISPYIPLRGDVTLISNFFDETLLKVSEFATESNGNVWLLSRGVSQKR